MRWVEASDVIPMFPSMVWKIQLEAGLRDALNANIEAALADLRRALPPLEPGADRINFHDPRPQAAVIRPPVVELTAENADQVVALAAANAASCALTRPRRRLRPPRNRRCAGRR